MQPQTANRGPFVGPRKPARRRPRLLPVSRERAHVTAFMSESLNLKLEVYCLLRERRKNDVVTEALQRLLDEESETSLCWNRPASEHRSTFILTSELKGRLDGFLSSKGWSRSDTLLYALMLFFQRDGIDPYTDPTQALWRALKA